MSAVLNHPWLLEDQTEEIANMNLTAPALSRLRNCVLSLDFAEKSLDRAGLRSHLTQLSMGKVVEHIERIITHKCDRFAEPDTERAEVNAGWRHALALHERQSGLSKALAAAEQEWHDTESEEAFARIREVKSLITNSKVLEPSFDT